MSSSLDIINFTLRDIVRNIAGSRTTPGNRPVLLGTLQDITARRTQDAGRTRQAIH
ncbi:MAG: hypothetical protein RLZZ445_1722 [Pseudomonadota bacterium]|jgi:hypothetical protein